MASHKRTVSAYLSQSHEKIFENNRKWVAAKKEADPEFFDKLSAGQTPEYLYVNFHTSESLSKLNVLPPPLNTIQQLQTGSCLCTKCDLKVTQC